MSRGPGILRLTLNMPWFRIFPGLSVLLLLHGCAGSSAPTETPSQAPEPAAPLAEPAAEAGFEEENADAAPPAPAPAPGTSSAADELNSALRELAQADAKLNDFASTGPTADAA